VTAIIAKLSELKYQMITDKPLEYFEPNFPDYEEWNQLLDGLKLKVYRMFKIYFVSIFL
jgi:hypothetical protein